MSTGSMAGKSRKRRILVADDSITIQKLVNLSLADTDFEVITCLDGYDANLKAKRLRPELVLIDEQLREISGVELCENIRQDPSLLNTKVILMRAKGAGGDEASIKNSPADMILDKPFDSKILLNSINQLIHEDESTVVLRPPEQEEEVTETIEVSKTEAMSPQGPFSSFRHAESVDSTEEATPEEQEEGEDSPFGGQKNLFSRLEEIAAEVVPPAAEQDITVKPHPDQAHPSNEDLQVLAQQEIQNWIKENLPKMAESMLKAEIAKLSQSE